jgi:hypothetical protein
LLVVKVLVLDQAAALHELSALVGKVAGEQERIHGLHFERESHKQHRVDAHGFKEPKITIKKRLKFSLKKKRTQN